MKIVGVGCGPGMLTPAAARAIEQADVVYGSDRAIELAGPALRPGCPVRLIGDYRALRTLGEGAVVLSTGDPMLSGLGFLPGEVVPGISSLQLALARLHIPWARAAVVPAHGRDHPTAIADAVDLVCRGRVAFVVADPSFSIPSLAAALAPHGPEIGIAVCERLGYPDERIAAGTAGAPPVRHSELFVVVAGRL